MEPSEYEALLKDVESRLDRLRALYEQWFQGFERLEPAVLRKEVDRRMYRLRRAKPHNTALRFRCNNLYQRYTVLQSYWNRVARQIEEGTYRRDLLRARRRRQDARQRRHEQQARGKEYEVDIEVDLDSLDTDAEIESALAALEQGPGGRPQSQAGAGRDGSPPPAARERTVDQAHGDGASGARPPVPAAAAPRPNDRGPVKATFGKPKDPLSSGRAAGGDKSGAGRSDVDDARLRRLYQQYIDARRRNNERTDVKYETLARSVRQMAEKQQRKHGGKKIDFQVVVRDGKVGLKPVAGDS